MAFADTDMSNSHDRRPSHARRETNGAGPGYVCDGCMVTVRWTSDAEQAGLPATWAKGKEGTFCLLCRRERAADAALESAPEATREDRAKLRAAAVIEFEVKRAPDRPNGEIAKACRASVAAVVRARERLAA